MPFFTGDPRSHVRYRADHRPRVTRDGPARVRQVAEDETEECLVAPWGVVVVPNDLDAAVAAHDGGRPVRSACRRPWTNSRRSASGTRREWPILIDGSTPDAISR